MSIAHAETPLSRYPYTNAAPNVRHKYLLPGIRRELSHLPVGSKVIDLGCGNGSLTASWARVGLEVYGVDWSESGIANAKLAYPGITFACNPIDATIDSLYDEGSFDAVVSAEVLEHLYAPRELARCAYKLLRPGGTLVVTTPYNGYLKNVALALAGSMDRHWTVLWDGGHIKFWSWLTIQALLKEADFVDIKFAGAGRLPFLWKSMIVTAKKT